MRASVASTQSHKSQGRDVTLTHHQGCGGCSWPQSLHLLPKWPSKALTQTSDPGSGPGDKERLRGGLWLCPREHTGRCHCC